MKLLHTISLRLLALTTVVLAFWSLFFYFEMMNEINDEVDDTLEDYAEAIIIRSLAGEEIPTTSIGSNNQFYQRPVSTDYALQTEHIRYADRDVFIHEKQEFEPARVLTYIYQNDAGQYYELEVSTPHIEKDDLRGTIFYSILSLFVALLLSILAINVFSIHRTMRPLRRLLKWVENFQIGKKNQALDNPTRIQEFAQLNKTVEESMMRSQKLFERQKNFLGMASHELQTPIAATMNRLESILDEESLSEKQTGDLLKAIHSLENMSQLNRSLLMFSKIENGQFNDTKRIDLSEQLTQLLTDYKEVYTHKNIAVDMQIKEPFIVKMDESLSSILLSNLLKNAYIHNIDGGKISINMSRNELHISNTGSYVPLDEKKVFNRFYTSGKKSSTGLGLSIVKAICAQYNLYIRYRFGEGRHHFIVRA